MSSSGNVHWVGTGLSTGSGLRLLGERAETLTVWGRTEDKARRCLTERGARGQARAYDVDALSAAVRPGDVVVSMLPATSHAELLDAAIARGAHFACTSYTSDEMADAAERARAAGTVILTEAGLDPGLDHVLAHDLVHRAVAAVGEGRAAVSFTSYCGGVPAVPNDFRYRFSWAPRGVLSALGSPARAIEFGRVRDIAHPWEATRRYALDGEIFEVYPNRDSTPFVAQYGFPTAWEPRTFVRGTMRLEGWRDAWAPVFEVVRAGDPAAIDALAADLLARYPMRPQDRDRVVLAVSLSARAHDGSRWAGRYLVDLIGDAGESAMARTVSLPLAYGVAAILDNATPPGLHKALPDPAGAEDFLAFLRKQGLEITLNEEVTE